MQLNEIHDNHEHASTSLKVILLVFAIVLVGALGYLVWQQNNDTVYQENTSQTSNKDRETSEIFLDDRFIKLTAEQKREIENIKIDSSWKKTEIKEGSFSLTLPSNMAKIGFIDQSIYDESSKQSLGDFVAGGIGASGEGFGDDLSGIFITKENFKHLLSSINESRSYLHSYIELVNGIKLTVRVFIDNQVKLPDYSIEKFYIFTIGSKTIRFGPVKEGTVVYDTPGESSDSVVAEALEFKSLKYYKMLDLAIHTIKENK